MFDTLTASREWTNWHGIRPREHHMTTLDAALQHFEATEANLAKIDTLWGQIEAPPSPHFE